MNNVAWNISFVGMWCLMLFMVTQILFNAQSGVLYQGVFVVFGATMLGAGACKELMRRRDGDKTEVGGAG